MLSLQMSQTNFEDIRTHKKQLVGNQGRYQRLTEAGIRRAQEIKKLRDSMRTAAASCRAEREAQIAELKQAHQWKNAEERLQLIRADIRSMLLARTTALSFHL